MNTHPSDEQLSAYNLGQLSPDEATAIESHIEVCDSCCDTMVAFASEDTFLEALRSARHSPADPTLDLTNNVASPATGSSNVPEPLAQHLRYEVLGLIGKGGMGDVYKAQHRKMERTVALKVINRDLVRKPEVVDRFHREVKAAAQLAHANIVTAFDADQVGDHHFMVMEFVDGVDLSRIINDRGPLPIDEACDYIRQAALGLQHAHERGMVHRDIKPHNLMVTTDGTLKILDFGLASLGPHVLSDGETVEARGELTVAGSIMGTPDYIAPEQAEDARQADVRSDIYSLGATFYFLLSGRAPFADGSIVQKLESHAQLEPDSLESLRKDIPVDLAAIVSKMMAKEPNDRFQTPEEVADVLATFAGVESPARETRANRKPDRGDGGFRKLATAALLLVGILAATVFYIQTNHGTVRVKVFDEALAVSFSGQTVRVGDGSKEFKIRVGERKKLVVRQAGSDVSLETESFQVRRNDAMLFEVQLVQGEIVVRKDGVAFGRVEAPASEALSSPLELSSSLAKGLPASKKDLDDFKKKLDATISRAAGIPNEQWEKIAKGLATPDAIQGTPLSLMLQISAPMGRSNSDGTPAEAFRLLTKGTPKPRDLHNAMALSQPHGYVSLIQPEYITKTTLDVDPETKLLVGTVWFEAPKLYAGKVDFLVESRGGQLKVIEFKLPEFGIRLIRNEEGVWARVAIDGDSNEPSAEANGGQ